MAKYEISHPELPQVRGILELPNGEQPSEKHFWEAAKTQVRPYGASQLTDKSKIIAYRNGFFDTPSTPILDQEDDPDTLQSEEQPGILSSLMDMGKEGVRRIAGGVSPHEKVILLGSKLDIYNSKIIAQDYSTDNFSEQLKEAGKITFGNLDNMVLITKVDDVVARSLRQVGLKPTKSNRAKAIKAARDYSEGNIKASLGMGVVRAQQTGKFVYEGLPYLTNKMLMDEADDSDVLDTVNSSISFDKLMYESENASKLAAFAMDNPLESIKASASGIVGGLAQASPVGIALGVDSEGIQNAISDKDSLSFDSQLQQDLSTGYQEPSEGLSLLTEVVADPLNLAGAPVAKAVTAPLRIGLKGRMLKTITDVQKNTTRLAQLQTVLKKLPEGARVTRGKVEGQIVKVTESLAEQQKILQKYGSNSLTLRLAGQASPETLGKVAMDTFDQSTEAGKIGMGLVREATKATDKMGKLRRVANVAAKYNPEIAGATVGAMIAGPGGAVVGAGLPTALKVARFIFSAPENVALRLIITSAQNAGEEITEQGARQKLRNYKALLGGGAFGVSGLGYSMDFDALADTVGVAGLATLLGPKSLSLFDNIARDARVIGSELTLARTGDHTPFFRRLAMLPTPDQGLAGATTDKFNILMRPGPEGKIARAGDALVQGSKMTAREVSPPPQAFRRGPQGEAIGQAPTISGATRSVANFLDKPGAVGRLGTPIEVLGRFGKGMAAGASIPTTIGFIASGGQASGAIAGVAMSAPFTALGSGAGMYQNYKTKGDLYAKQIGDVQYYREHLTKPEQVEFDALPANIRAQIAGYSLSHPDAVFKQTTEGEGGFNPVTMEVTYNPNGTGYLKGSMAHEITHFMEIHGLTPTVNRVLFGDESTGMAGEFASYDSDGKIVYTDEFIKLRDIYMDKLRKDASLNSQEAIDAVTAYESDPKLIGREIFADQGADFLLSGKREKALNQGPLGKLVGATIDGITGVSFLRDFLLKLNLPLNSEGKFITSTGLFDGKLREIPELQNLIEKYYKDVRGLKKAQIEGEKITDASGRTIEKKGARPIDDEFDTLYTVEDQKDPNVVDNLNTGGIFKTNPTTGEVERDSLKNPIRMTKGEADKVSKAVGEYAAKVFERNGIEVEMNDKGQPFVKDLGALSEDIIDQLAKGPIHSRQIAALREISRALRQGDGERAGMLLGYYSASTGRKPKAVPFKLRTTMPYGFELTSQGNILVRLHDTQQIQRNLKFLKGELQAKKLPDELIGMYDDLFGDDNAVWDAFSTYRNNTSNGIDGRTGLDPDPVRANKKLNFLNALHGAFDKAHVAKNPVLSAIGYKRASSNNKREPFGTATRTFRLDRIFDAKRSGTASGFNLERAKNLMSPQGQKLMMPQMEMDFSPPKAAQSLEAKPNFWKIYRINPKGPKVYDQVADVLIQVGSPWMDGSIAESQAGKLRLDQNKLLDAMGRAHRRADRGGGKMFMPSGDRAKVGGQIGKNQEFYKGGQWLPSTTMPKRERQSIRKAATGKEQFEPYKWEVPEPGKKPILGEYDVFSNIGDEQFIKYQGYSPTEINFYREMKARWDAGERYYDIYEFPFKANKKDVSRLYEAGKEILPEMLVDRDGNPKHFAEVFQKFPQKQGGEGKQFMPASELKKEFGAKQAKEIQYKRLFMPTSKDGEDYRGYHEAPDRDYGAPLHDVTGMYPSDIYGPNGARYYGTGDSAMDAKSIAIIQEMYGNPDGEVTIYRAVPEFADEIRPNDWVTIVREYAELHGESGNAGGDGYNILSKKVKASELFTEANSLHEWGWSPENKSSKQFMPASEAGASKGKVAEAAKLWNEMGIESPYFKKWFGKSKVVDEKGEPLVVYHGSPEKNIGIFKSHIDRGGLLAFFSEKKSFADEYGKSGQTYSAYLKADKPFDYRKHSETAKDFYDEVGGIQDGYEVSRILQGLGRIDESMDPTHPSQLTKQEYYEVVKKGGWDAIESPEFVEYLKDYGFDAVIMDEGGSITYGVFSPEQIKSATGNRGTFDAGEGNILFMPSDSQVQPRSVETGFSTENIPDKLAPKFIERVLGDLSIDAERVKYNKPSVHLPDHLGRNALITMGDRTPTGHTIYGMKGIQFKEPLRLGGGRDYMFDSKTKEAVWANEQGPMTAMLNRKQELGGDDMLIIPMEMATTSVDFPTMAPALHIRYAQVALNPKDKKYINKLIRNGGDGQLPKNVDAVKVPGFDVDRKNIDKYLGELTGPQRKTINNVFNMVNRPSPKQKDAGIKQLEGTLHNMEMRAAISDPDMFNQKSLMQTTNVGLITGGQVPSRHQTYNAAMKGEGLGALNIPRERPATAQDFLPELFLNSTPDKISSTDAYTARMGVRTAKITKDLLSRLGY